MAIAETAHQLGDLIGAAPTNPWGAGQWRMDWARGFRRPSQRPLSRLVYELGVDNLDDFALVVDRWDDRNYELHFVVVQGRCVTGATIHLVLGGPGSENLPGP